MTEKRIRAIPPEEPCFATASVAGGAAACRVLIGVARRAGTVVVAGRTGARCAFRFGVEVALCLCRAGGDRRFARARVCDVRGVTAAGVKELRRTPALVPVAPREPPSLPAPVAVFPPPETPAAAGVSQDSCRIEWWRGWVRSQFVACSSNGSGHKTLIADLDRTPGPHPYLVDLVAKGELGMSKGKGFRTWTPETAAALRKRLSDFLAQSARAMKEKKR